MEESSRNAMKGLVYHFGSPVAPTLHLHLPVDGNIFA